MNLNHEQNTEARTLKNESRDGTQAMQMSMMKYIPKPINPKQPQKPKDPNSRNNIKTSKTTRKTRRVSLASSSRNELRQQLIGKKFQYTTKIIGGRLPVSFRS